MPLPKAENSTQSPEAIEAPDLVFFRPDVEASETDRNFLELWLDDEWENPGEKTAEARETVVRLYSQLGPRKHEAIAALVRFDTDDVNATLAELAANLQLTAEETELLDSIVMLYGSKSQNGLIFLTHAEQPWVEAREGLAPYQRSEKEISLDTMHAYYKARHDRNRQKQ